MHVEQIGKLLLDGNLMSPGELQAALTVWRKAGPAPDDGASFVLALVQQQTITEFQGQALLAGLSGPYLLGPYEVFARLAVGRLGNVFRAVHREFQQPVALKIFPSAVSQDPDRAARLARETRVAVQVDHPHVVRTFQVGRVGPVIFLAFEDLQGETLADHLTRAAEAEAMPNEPYHACRLVYEAALGLHYLHSEGVLLRDIQPANIWVTSDGHVKLMEFGAARDALAFVDTEDPDEIDAEKHSDLLGSYDYLSPDQGTDLMSADARSDIYALGCVFFRCLTGEVLFPGGNPVRKMLRHAREPARRASDVNPTVPPELSDIVAKMLAKDPAQRHQRADEIAKVLELYAKLDEIEEAVTATPIHYDFLDWVNSATVADTTDALPEAEADPAFLELLDALSSPPRA